MKKIKLQYPIKVKDTNGNDIECSEITFQRIKLKHLKLLPDDIVEKGEAVHPKYFIPLIAGLANLNEEEADEIDFVDLTDIVEVLEDFLGSILGGATKR